MRARSLLAAGATAIAVLVAGAIVLLWTAGRPPTAVPPRGGARDAARPAGAGAPRSPTAAPLLATEGPRGAAAAPATAPPAPLPEDVDPSWREAPVAFTIRELGAVAPYVHGGLRDVREELRRCSGSSAGAEAGSSAPDPDAAAAPPRLVLYLEAREGAIDVVEVRSDRSGSWTRDALECCRGVLRGHEIPAPNAAPGRRYRLVLDPLQ